MPQPKFPKRKVWLDCGKYILRTITTEDASDRWANWMADPEASIMLNAAPRTMTKSDIVAYIKTLRPANPHPDRHFRKGERTAARVPAQRRRFCHRPFLVSMIIGEPEYRHSGVTNAVTIPFRDYFFETLGMKVMLATALAHNRPIIHYLYSTGWTLDRTIERHVKSNSDDQMFDLCFFSQTREAWREWKKAKLGGSPMPKPEQT
jgi:RimJ/RimL family protein N-acetyltransferase